MEVTLLLFGISLLFAFPGSAESQRVITKNLTLSTGLDFGDWGEEEYCPDGSFAVDLEVMFQDYFITHLDETAINAVKLYCSTLEGIHNGYITSTVGENGEWQGMRPCPNGLMTGTRGQVLDEQGLLGDDVAVQNVEMQCNYGESKVTGVLPTSRDVKINEGDWSEWGQCEQDSAVCGIKIRYEKPSLVADTTAISNIMMYCCAIL
ncbi:hypothetical protein SK128_005239 [Halocaridina rubra]|uniref:Vitelline membrane outer layer protein 1 homolog n=1 Tax=Halocaridina rubra TaxID=373956 RepID=A0AAN8WN15_HALRR